MDERSQNFVVLKHRPVSQIDAAVQRLDEQCVLVLPGRKVGQHLTEEGVPVLVSQLRGNNALGFGSFQSQGGSSMHA